MRNLLVGVLAAAAAFLQAPAAQPPPIASLVLTGHVVTGSGPDSRPVRHARVTLAGGALRTPRLADTDATGSYRFERLASANYRVSVRKAGFVTVTTDAAPDATLTMVHGGAIEGVVMDAGGEPVTNVVVSALQLKAGATPSVAAETRTDDLGRYRLYSLDVGEYVVQAATDRTFIANMSLTPGQKAPDTTTAFYPAASALENAKAVHVELARDVSGMDVTLTPSPPVADPAGRPQRPAEEPTGTGHIAGRITDGASGKPIKGARLLLLPRDGVRLTNWTSTDARGRFEYTNLAARKYTLQVGADGHVTVEYGRTRPGEAGVLIDVMDGQDVSIDMSLPRTTAIEGVLTDEFGDPAPGLVVEVGRKVYAAGRKRLALGFGRFQPQPTDDRGHYRIFGIEPGEYVVGALANDVSDPYALGGVAPTYYPGTLDPASAMLVTASPGADNLGISFTVSLPRTFMVTGTMVGPDGRPVSGRGTLWLQTPDSPQRLDMNLARSATASDGQFVIHNIPQGQYILQGFGPSPSGYKGPGNLNAMPFGWMPLAVGDADVDDVILKVTDGTKLRGRIVKDDDNGPPLTPQQVQVTTVPIELNSAFMGGGPSPSETHDDWTFEVTHQTGQRRIIAAVASPLWMVKKITRDQIDVTDEPFDFREKDVSDVEVVVTSKVTRLTGGVTDDHGQVSDYAVVIFSSDPTKWVDRSRYVVMARGVQQGRFDVRSLPPDDYFAVALPNVSGTEWMDPEFLQAIRPQATSFSLQEGESKTLELRLKRRP